MQKTTMGLAELLGDNVPGLLGQGWQGSASGR